MRSMIISAAAFLFLILFWWFFMGFCEASIADLTDLVHQRMVVEVREKNWDAAAASFDAFDEMWHKNKRWYSLFLNETAILDIDCSVARLKAYVECADDSSSLGELSAISEQLKFLFLRERISLENLF